MKLIWCDHCHSVVQIIEQEWRQCQCGSCGGQYNFDRVTATVGGFARIFGIANPFFSKEFWEKNTKEKMEFRYKYWPEGDGSDCWWGDYKGERQLFHIQSAVGPRLRIRSQLLKIPLTPRVLVRVMDERNFLVDGKKRNRVLLPASAGIRLSYPRVQTLGEVV